MSVYSWNVCGITQDDLTTFVKEMHENVVWDAVCIQEGQKGVEEGLLMHHDHWVLRTGATQRGATMLLLHPRLGRRLRRRAIGPDYVLAEIALRPPVVICSWHAPSVSAGVDAFETSLEMLLDELRNFRELASGSTRLVLAGDFNCQLSENAENIGQFGKTCERREDLMRACHVHGALSVHDLRVFSSYVDYGPTRFPWPMAAAKGDSATVLDFICASSLQGEKADLEFFPQIARSDHIPIGMRFLAPVQDRRRRRKLMENVLAPSCKGGLPAKWVAKDREQFKKELEGVQPDTLGQLAEQTVALARRHAQPNWQKDPERTRLLKGLREATDPVTRRAYQIHLRAHLREKCVVYMQ